MCFFKVDFKPPLLVGNVATHRGVKKEVCIPNLYVHTRYGLLGFLVLQDAPDADFMCIHRVYKKMYVIEI